MPRQTELTRDIKDQFSGFASGRSLAPGLEEPLIGVLWLDLVRSSRYHQVENQLATLFLPEEFKTNYLLKIAGFPVEDTRQSLTLKFTPRIEPEAQFRFDLSWKLEQMKLSGVWVATRNRRPNLGVQLGALDQAGADGFASLDPETKLRSRHLNRLGSPKLRGQQIVLLLELLYLVNPTQARVVTP